MRRRAAVWLAALTVLCHGCGLLRRGPSDGGPPGQPEGGRFGDIEAPPAESVRDAAEKVRRLRAYLNGEDLAAAIVGREGDFAWITGGVPLPGSLLAGSRPVIVITPTGKHLLGTRAATTILLRRELGGQGYQQHVVPWTQDASGVLNSVLPEGRVVSDVAVAAQRPVERLASYAFLYWPLTDVGRRRYRWVGHKTAAALGAAARTIRPGMTELDVARRLRRELASWDIQAVQLDVSSGQPTELALGPPRNVPVERLVVLRLVAQRWGLHAAATRSVDLGDAGDLPLEFRHGGVVMAKMWAATESSQRLGQVARAAQEAYAEAGHPDAWRHLSPGGSMAYGGQGTLARPTSTTPIRPGMTFVWRARVGGARLEETVLLTERGVEVLTRSGEWPMVEVRIGEAAFSVPGLMME